MAYSARCTPREGSEDEANFLKAMVKIGGKYVVTREHGEHGNNMHMHAVIWSPRTSVQVRSTIQNCIGHKVGNGVFSLKLAKDEDAALRYICKGDSEHPHPKGSPPEVVSRMGVTADDIAEAYEGYWAQSKKVKETKGVAFHIQVEQYMVQNQMEFNVRQVVKAVMEMTIAKKNTLNESYMLWVAKLVMARRDKRYREELENRLVWRMENN